MRLAFALVSTVLLAATGALAQATPPAGWTCDPTFFGDGFCDCGCGAPDDAADCTDNTLASCQASECATAGQVASKTDPSQCVAGTCGDGVFDFNSTETCDDGNNTPGDGCSATCTIEASFDCDTFSHVTTSCVAIVCGDGIVASTEGCDDGNQTPGDGCSATCTLETGFVCHNAGQPCTHIVCGDGFVDDPEACDDGNTQAGDGCSADCSTVEPNFSCRTPGAACVAVPAGWTCDPAYYSAGAVDGCDCGCGIGDPDCPAGTTPDQCSSGTGFFDDCSINGQQVDPNDITKCVAGAGEGEGEGEGAAGEGEGEGAQGGEGEGAAGGEGEGSANPDKPAPSCGTTPVSSSTIPASVLLLGGLTFLLRRKR